MYESRRFAHRKRFRPQVDPVMLALLAGAVLLGCGILIGHVATVHVQPEPAADIQAAIYR